LIKIKNTTPEYIKKIKEYPANFFTSPVKEELSSAILPSQTQSPQNKNSFIEVPKKVNVNRFILCPKI